MIHKESHLQQACVKWFRLQYPTIANLLFAVPNGGARSRTEAAIMKGEGVTAGVADLLLLIARGGFGSLAIEMKDDRKNAKQRPSQIQWQQAAEQAGNKYAVIRTFEEFQNIVNAYLTEPATNPERQNPHIAPAYVLRRDYNSFFEKTKQSSDGEQREQPQIHPSGMCCACIRCGYDFENNHPICRMTGEKISTRIPTSGLFDDRVCAYFLKQK